MFLQKRRKERNVLESAS